MSKQLPPLTKEFFQAAIASGAITLPISGPDRPVRYRALWVAGFIVLLVGAFCYGALRW